MSIFGAVSGSLWVWLRTGSRRVPLGQRGSSWPRADGKRRDQCSIPLLAVVWDLAKTDHAAENARVDTSRHMMNCRCIGCSSTTVFRGPRTGSGRDDGNNYDVFLRLHRDLNHLSPKMQLRDKSSYL